MSPVADPATEVSADVARQPNRWVAGASTAAVGLAVANAVALLTGFLAKSLHNVIDVPLYDRVNDAGTNSLTDVLLTVTKMGNGRQTQVVAAVGGVGLAVWFARRGWKWLLPLIAMPAAWIVARAFQLVLARIVDREQGVMTLANGEIGGYPSGGVTRVVLIFGLIAFFVVRYAGLAELPARALYACVAMLGLIEAFARFRLNQHWFTDIVGGAIFGTLLLLAAAAIVRSIDPHPPNQVDSSHDPFAHPPTGDAYPAPQR